MQYLLLLSFYSFESFSHQHLLIVFHLSLEWQQVFSSLQNFFIILAGLNNAVVSMVFSRPLNSNSSSHCTTPFVTVLSVPITIGITVTFMFYGVFNSQARSNNYLSFHFLSVLLWGQPKRQSSLLCRFSRSGRLAEIRWFVCIPKFQRILFVSFSKTDFWLCKYHLFVWSNLNFLHNYQWVILPTQSCLDLYSLWINLLHSLFMWLVVSAILLRLVYSCFDIVSLYGVNLSWYKKRFNFSPRILVWDFSYCYYHYCYYYHYFCYLSRHYLFQFYEMVAK